MKHTLSRLRYAANLTSLKHNYERFLTIFKKHYPLGTEVQMIDHYINHYKTSITVADRNIDRNQKSLRHLSDEKYEEFVIRTENHVFDYGNMVKWLEEKKATVLESGQKKDNKSEQEELTKDKLLKEQNHLIPKVSIEDVYNYFEILTTSTNREGKYYLTEKQLLTFIKGTFIDLKPIQQHLNGVPNSKKDIRSLFFRFYVQCSNLEYNTTHKKQKYFDIMFEAFGTHFEKRKDFEAWNKTNQKIIGKEIPKKPKT